MRKEHEFFNPLLVHDALEALDSASTDLALTEFLATEVSLATDLGVLADAVEAEAAALSAIIARRLEA